MSDFHAQRKSRNTSGRTDQKRFLETFAADPFTHPTTGDILDCTYWEFAFSDFINEESDYLEDIALRLKYPQWGETPETKVLKAGDIQAEIQRLEPVRALLRFIGVVHIDEGGGLDSFLHATPALPHYWNRFLSERGSMLRPMWGIWKQAVAARGGQLPRTWGGGARG